MAIFLEIISVLSDVLAGIASAIAIYLFAFKRAEIASVFKVLANFSLQNSISELKTKIDKVNEIKARDADGVSEVIELLHEIIGQIKGNQKLFADLKDIVERIEAAVSDRKKMTEPLKRSLISELRERVKYVDVKSIDKFMEQLK